MIRGRTGVRGRQEVLAMRRLIAGGLIVLVASLGPGVTSSAQTASEPRGEIRVVDKSPNNWIYLTWHVFEHLLELDKNGVLVPRLATSWKWVDDRTLEFKLRQGVKFHN